MNETQITGASFFNNVSRPELVPDEAPRHPATGFMHPDEVVADLWLTHAEKREILASWASDARAVPDAPALRQLDNGAVVRVDNVLLALNSLDEGEASEHTTFNPFRPLVGLHTRLPRRPRLPSGRRWSDDDDDPPPCPATIAGPLCGPLFGGAIADPSLALAA